MNQLILIQVFIAFFSLVSFYGSCLVGHLTMSVIGVSFAFSAGVIWILRNYFIDKFQVPPITKKELLIFITVSPLILFQFVYLCFYSEQSWFIGDPFNYGDLSFHIGLINYFSRGGLYWPDNFIFANHILKYPALVDHFSAVMSLLGISLRSGFFLVGLLSTFLTYFLLLRLGGYFLVFAFFFGSGLYQWADLLQGSLFKVYETVDFKSLLLSVFIPQRGFQWAIPLGLFLIFKLKKFHETGRLQKKEFIVISILWATLAMVHVHTFFVFSFLILIFFILNKKYRQWVETSLLAFILSLPYWWMVFSHNQDATAFLHLDWFWTWNKTENLFFYFIKNWSLLFLLLFYFLKEVRQLQGFLKIIFYFGLGLFFFAQFIILAPWNWDNIKILLWAYILLLWVFSTFIHRRDSAWIFYILLLPGLMVSIKYVAHRGADVRWLSGEEIVESNWLKTIANVNQIFLIAPEANHPAIVAGQRVLLGYPGNVWSQGSRYDFIETDYKLIQDSPAQIKNILNKYEVSGIFWGERERRYFKHESLAEYLGPDWTLKDQLNKTEVWVRIQ